MILNYSYSASSWEFQSFKVTILKPWAPTPAPQTSFSRKSVKGVLPRWPFFLISHKQLTFIFPCSLYIMFMEYLLRCSDICFLLLFTMNFHQLILDWMSPSFFLPYFLPFLSSISHHFHINFHINLSRNPLQDEPLLVINGVITPYKWPYKWVAGVITPYNWFSGPTL